MQEHLSPKLLQLLLPSFPAPSYSEQREGRRDSKANVFSGRCVTTRGEGKKEEMSDRESEKERSINSILFLWDSVRTTLYCFVSYETDKHAKIKTNPAPQHAEGFHWSKVTNNCLSSFIRTDALKKISTMILYAGKGFWRQTLITLYITICYFQKNYSETWLIVKENLF